MSGESLYIACKYSQELTSILSIFENPCMLCQWLSILHLQCFLSSVYFPWGAKCPYHKEGTLDLDFKTPPIWNTEASE